MRGACGVLQRGTRAQRAWARIGSRRTVDPVGSVGGGHGDDTLARRHAVEQREQLRHRAPVIAAAARVRPLRTERVELVHEEERRGGLPTCDGCRLGLGLGPSKRRAQPCAQLVSSAPTATALQHEQRKPKGSRSRAHNVGFACPGWAIQEQPRGRPHPPCPQRVGVFGEAAHQRAHRVVGAALPGEDRGRLGARARCWFTPVRHGRRVAQKRALLAKHDVARGGGTLRRTLPAARLQAQVEPRRAGIVAHLPPRHCCLCAPLQPHNR
mgnify:CR=1 FL=1